MNKPALRRWLWLPVGLALLALGLWELSSRPASPTVTVQPGLTGLTEASQGFSRATGPLDFTFSGDFGAHPDFQTEWWYYTGNLDTPDGRHFGFQLTFFRRALLPPQADAARLSDWAANQVYLGHFALTDVQGNRFYSFEKLERGAAGLAGAEGEPSFQVWLDDWSVAQTGEQSYRLSARQDGLSLELDLTDELGTVFQGDNGYSQKGPEAGNASYYFSQPGLRAGGEIGLNGQTFTVSGKAWMDHEYSTSALSAGQTGWDWFAFQFEDGSALMLYQIRRADGSRDPYSAGTLISADGAAQRLAAGDFSVRALDSWTSPHSGAVYPSGWEIQVPGGSLQVEAQPYLKDQENNLSFTYWEGAVKIEGQRGGARLKGSGYVELTGYSGSLAGQF